jgi:hypothetical protein
LLIEKNLFYHLKLGGESKEKSIFIGEAKKKLDQRNQQ